MAQFKIEIDGDTCGHATWRLTGVHQTDGDKDADNKRLTSVLNKLTDFTKQLEAISQEEE